MSVVWQNSYGWLQTTARCKGSLDWDGNLTLKFLADKLPIEFPLAGRQECFSALMDRHMGRPRRHINGLIPNTSDAENMAQEAQLKVWMNLCSFRFDSTFCTWTVRIAINGLCSGTDAWSAGVKGTLRN
jgi:hypothetical protein